MADILIIDDDQEISGMLSAAVRDMGHRVQLAFTLSAGREEFSSASFDVVFLDVVLPDGNAFLATLEMREPEFPPEIIIITGAGDNLDGAELAIRTPLGLH